MMHHQHEFMFAEGDGFVAVRLPLLRPLEFVLLLPAKRDGLAVLEKKMSPELLSGSKLKFERRDVILSLPRFRIEPPGMSLATAFKVLGMKSAFDIPQGNANFERIAPRRPNVYLAISDVFHKTFLNVDEKGVEAAAATAIVMKAAGAHAPAKPVEVTVDHPFLFSIVATKPRDAGGDTCLFLGHVVDPR